jgi:hypothetical protein
LYSHIRITTHNADSSLILLTLSCHDSISISLSISLMYESLNEPRMYLYTLAHSISIVIRNRDDDQAFVALQRLLPRCPIYLQCHGMMRCDVRPLDSRLDIDLEPRTSELVGK